MSGKSEKSTFQELREIDKKLFEALKNVVNDEQTHSTSEWSILLNKDAQFKINPQSLGKSFKRLTEFPLLGLQMERPETRNKKAKLWKIIPSKS